MRFGILLTHFNPYAIQRGAIRPGSSSGNLRSCFACFLQTLKSRGRRRSQQSFAVVNLSAWRNSCRVRSLPLRGAGRAPLLRADPCAAQPERGAKDSRANGGRNANQLRQVGDRARGGSALVSIIFSYRLHLISVTKEHFRCNSSFFMSLEQNRVDKWCVKTILDIDEGAKIIIANTL